MTLDEAINAEMYDADMCIELTTKEEKDYHKQIVYWLKELKTLRYCKDKWNENQYEQRRKDAIDEFIEWLYSERRISYHEKKNIKDWFIKDKKERADKEKKSCISYSDVHG